MEKRKFIQTIEYTAVRFDPNEHPWHRSVQRQTIDGVIPIDFERYFCIIPLSGIEYLKAGDWIIVDDMDNAKGVLDKIKMEMLNIKQLDE